MASTEFKYIRKKASLVSNPIDSIGHKSVCARSKSEIRSEIKNPHSIKMSQSRHINLPPFADKSHQPWRGGSSSIRR